MNKNDFNDWLTRRVEFQTKITMGAVASMVGLGLLAFLFQGGLLYVLLKWGYGTAVAFLAVVGIFGGMGAYTWMTAPKALKDERHTVLINDRKINIRVAPTLAHAWTFALGSMESDQSIFERIFGMMMLVPRMFWTAWYLSSRLQDVREIDVLECGKVLRMLLRKAERVEVTAVAEKFSKMDVAQIVRQVSLIDGVVFLTKGEVAMTLANRFKEDLEKGLPAGSVTASGEDQPFD